MKTVHFLIGGAASVTLLFMALPIRGKTLADAPAEADDSEAVLDATSPTVAAEVRPGPSPQQLEAQRKRRAELAWGRDPFAAPVTPTAPDSMTPDVAEPPTLVVEQDVPPEAAPEVVVPRLSGISRRGTTHWAIIDHEIVSVGDELATGHRVARIDPRAVTLALGSDRLTLKLGEER